MEKRRSSRKQEDEGGGRHSEGADARLFGRDTNDELNLIDRAG